MSDLRAEKLKSSKMGHKSNMLLDYSSPGTELSIIAFLLEKTADLLNTSLHDFNK